MSADSSTDQVQLACFLCGKVLELSSSAYEQLKTEISKETGFQIRVIRLEVGGLCRDCRQAPEPL